jgi:hypothetical protein
MNHDSNEIRFREDEKREGSVDANNLWEEMITTSYIYKAGGDVQRQSTPILAKPKPNA